jgi:phage repressor protein C with HTH and peptisase S24 domain
LTGRRPIGAKLVRQIEEALNLPKYSLNGDEEHSDFVQVSQLSVGTSEESDEGSSLMAELGALQFQREFLRSVGVSAVYAALVHVAGTSMEPMLRDGAVILLNRADRAPRAGCVYAFVWEGQRLVRRFQRVGDDWHTVSDNADKGEHPNIVLLGRLKVRCRGGRFG